MSNLDTLVARKVVVSEAFSATTAPGTSGFSCHRDKLKIRWCLTSVRLNSGEVEIDQSWWRRTLGLDLIANGKLLSSATVITWPEFCTDLRSVISDYKICRKQMNFALPLNPYNFMEKFDEQ